MIVLATWEYKYGPLSIYVHAEYISSHGTQHDDSKLTFCTVKDNWDFPQLSSNN